MKKAICLPCDMAYLKGLEGCINALERWNLDADIVVISEDIPESDRYIVHRPNPADYNRIPQGARRYVVYYFYESLRLRYDRVLWLGVDQLIVGDISGMLEGDAPIMAVPESAGNGFTGLVNSGMFSIMPKKFPNIWNELIEIAMTGQYNRLDDQTVLNEWIRRNGHEVKLMPQTWDVLKRVWKNDPEWWNANKADFKSIHYVGIDKPWNGGERGYDALNEYWRKYTRGEYGEVPRA